MEENDDECGHHNIEIDDFHTDEEPENSERQQEDMKQYMNKLNKRIDRILSRIKQVD